MALAVPARKGVGGEARQEGPDDGPHQQRSDEGLLVERARTEVLGDEEQGAGDGPGVVAKQETAEGGDDGQTHDEPRPSTEDLA